MSEERKLLDERNREVIRLTGVIHTAVNLLKRGEQQEALLTLISATLQADAKEWAPDRD